MPWSPEGVTRRNGRLVGPGLWQHDVQVAWWRALIFRCQLRRALRQITSEVQQ